MKWLMSKGGICVIYKIDILNTYLKGKSIKCGSILI